MATTKIDQELDARGLLCPMPVVKTAKAMRELPAGAVLKLLATDKGSVTDVAAWADTTGNELLEWHEEDGVFVYLLRKAAG
jgi:tRNA 2-thiouridine synthesizing protein A